MATNPDLAEHLRFFEELGVTGVSRDPAWRRRVQPASPDGQQTASTDQGTSAPTDDLGGRWEGRRSPMGTEVNGEGRRLPTGTEADGEGRRSPTGTEVADGTLTLLKDEIGPACTRCKLHTLGRRQVVFGVGNPRADLMFVGEAPGEDEDKQGEPFVGRAGQLLTRIIESIGLTRDQVYIANVIKCRPPGNRNPEPDEVERCEPFLFRQIDAIKPRVIVALGKFAAQSLLKTTEPITRLRGREYNYRGATLIPTFHPAYLLRNPSSKREVWEDMKKVRAILQSRE